MDLFKVFRKNKIEQAFSLPAPITDISTARQLANFITLSKSSIGTFDYNVNLEQAFYNNVVVAFCIDLLATTACQIPVKVFIGDKEISRKNNNSNNTLIGLYDWLQTPGYNMTWNDFVTKYIHYRNLAGEYFLHRVSDNNTFMRGNGEVEFLSPEYMTYKSPSWIYTKPNTTPVIFQHDDKTLLHRANFDPKSNRGLSRLTPAWQSIQQFNSGSEHNYNLLQNGGRLGLVVTFEGEVSETQAAEWKARVQDFTGPGNAGKTLVIAGDGKATVTEFGTTPKDMDFSTSQEQSARQICWALGVDPIFLGLKGDSTYSNKEAALPALFTHRVLPMMENLREDLNNWFQDIWGTNFEIRYDLDAVPALEEMRNQRWDKQEKAKDILTIDERRALLGFDPLPNGEGKEIATAKEPNNINNDQKKKSQEKPDEPQE